MRKNNRRNFLKAAGIVGAGAGAAMLPENLLFNALLGDLFTQSTAHAADLLSPRNYINISLGGGPIRYAFDHWLKTAPNEPAMIHSSHNSTGFNYDSAMKVTGSEYKTFEYKGYLVPSFFLGFPTAQRNKFLDSFLMIRGYGTGIDGHGVNSDLQKHPLASAPSITGLMADHSNRTFQAVQYPPMNSPFSARSSATLNALSGSTPLKSLLSPLTSTKRVRNLSRSMPTAFDDVRRALNSINEPAASVKIAKASLNNTYSLLKSSLTDFDTQWPLLLAKYQTAIVNAMKDQFIPGLNATEDGSRQISYLTNQTDIGFDTGGADGFINANSNLCALGEFVTASPLAAGLALAEYCIKNKLVSAFEIGAGVGQDGLNLAAGNGKSLFSSSNDNHGGGGHVDFVAKSLYFRGIVAGLLTLQTELEATNDWQNTIVHLVSEFNRTIGRSNGGSGHGTEQMVSSVFSGVFTGGPYVVGNVGTSGDLLKGAPTQGIALPISNYNVSDRPTPIMMTSTVAELMGVSYNPWRNFQAPLITLSGGRLTLPFGRGKMSVIS